MHKQLVAASCSELSTVKVIFKRIVVQEHYVGQAMTWCIVEKTMKIFASNLIVHVRTSTTGAWGLSFRGQTHTMKP